MPAIEKHETLDRDALEQLQIERLQSTLNRVYRNVAFYRHLFDAQGRGHLIGSYLRLDR